MNIQINKKSLIDYESQEFLTNYHNIIQGGIITSLTKAPNTHNDYQQKYRSSSQNEYISKYEAISHNILELLSKEKILEIQVYKPNEPFELNRGKPSFLIACLRHHQEKLGQDIRYGGKQDKHIIATRIGGITFYRNANYGQENTGNVANEEQITYNIYLFKLCARYALYKNEDITKSFNKFYTIIENNTQQKQLSSYITTIRNILYNFRSEEKLLSTYMDNFSVNNRDVYEEIPDIFHMLFYILKQGSAFDDTPSNIIFSTQDMKEILSKYTTLITVYANTLIQKKTEEDIVLADYGSEGKFILPIQTLLIKRFFLKPTFNGRLYNALFLGTYAYITAGGKISGAWGHLKIKNTKLMIELSKPNKQH